MKKTERKYRLDEILKKAFQTNLDEHDYIRDSEVSHIYDKKQEKYLDFYTKKNQANLHALFQTEVQKDLSKDGFYPLSIDVKTRLKVLLDFVGSNSFEDLVKKIASDIANLDINIENLQAIISDINSLTAIISNIGTMNTNISNLQAIISDINNIETQIIAVNSDTTNLQAIISDINNLTAIISDINSLTAIIGNIGTMNTNISNLQAIISDIENMNTSIGTITTQNTLIDNLQSLQAIITNIGTINTNITNLQAIISDIENIETQIISVKTNIATINSNIGIINTAIANVEGHQVDIDTNINSVENLTTNFVNQENKGLKTSNIEIISTGVYDALITTNDYLYNQLTVRVYNDSHTELNYDVNIGIMDIEQNDYQFLTTLFYYGKACVRTYNFSPTHNIHIFIGNNTISTIKIDFIFSYAEFLNPNVIDLEGKIQENDSKTYYFVNRLNLYNRAIIHISYESSGTLNCQLDIKTNKPLVSEYTVKSLSLTTGTSYYAILDFDSLNNIKLILQNNHATLDMLCSISFFFSKKYTDSEVESVITAELAEGESIDNAIDALILAHENLPNAHHTPIEFPIGTILMFSGTWQDNVTIVGWYKCDGNNGTVNLVDKFVRGGTTSGATGGSDDAVVVSHVHSIKRNTGIDPGTGGYCPSNIGASLCDTQSAGVSGTGKNIPAYYQLIFIQRIS